MTSTAIVPAVPDFSDFSPPLRECLRIVVGPDPRDAEIITSFLASFVHPDLECNLDDLQRASIEARAAAMETFEFALTQGLTAEEQGDLLRWLTPFLRKGTAQ